MSSDNHKAPTKCSRCKRSFIIKDSSSKVGKLPSDSKKCIYCGHIQLEDTTNAMFEKKIEQLNKELKTVQHEKAVLSEQIMQKNQHINSLNEELVELRALNRDFQRQAIRNFDQINASLDEMRYAGVDAMNGSLPVAYVRPDGKKIHLGHNVWISTERYALIVSNANTPSIFVSEVLTAVFTHETLMNSTLSGKPSNRTKAEMQKQQQKLDGAKVLAIKEIFRHWLLTEKKMTMAEADAEVDKTKEYIRKKLAGMKDSRPSKRLRKKLSQSETDRMEMELREANAPMMGHPEYEDYYATSYEGYNTGVPNAPCSSTEGGEISGSDPNSYECMQDVKNILPIVLPYS